MPPVLMGAAVAAMMIATVILIRRHLALKASPVRVRRVQTLRRDPRTGEYRPF